MQRFASRLAALPIAFLLAAPAVCQEQKPAAEKPAQKHMVRFSFKEGTKRHSVLNMDMTMTMNMGGEDLVTKMKMTMWTTTTVKACKGNTAQIEQKTTRIKAVANSIAMKVNYDSDDPDSDPGQMEGLEDLVGEVTTMKLTDQGKMSDIKVPEATKQMMGSTIDINGITKSMVTQLPDQPIAIGETWKVEQKMPIGQFGKADGVSHFKLVAIDKKTLTLEETMVLDADKLNLPGLKGMTMTTKGTRRIELATGIPLEMDSTATTVVDGPMKMEMAMRHTIKPAAAPKKKPSKPTTGK